MKRRVTLMALSTVFLSSRADAQGLYWSLAYEPSVPVGSLRNAVADATAAGGSFGLRYLFTKYWSLGAGGHWNHFAENYPKATYPIDEGAITGAIYRRVWVASALAEVHVYLAPDAAVCPYLGVGAGVSWISNQLSVSDLTFDDPAHGFTMSPEVGVLIAFDRDMFEPGRTAMQSVIVGIRSTVSSAGSRDVSSITVIGVTAGLLVY
jgi:hypothetical protein